MTVSDNGSSQRNTTVSVRVFTEWVNDNTPEFPLLVSGDCVVLPVHIFSELFENQQPAGERKKRHIEPGMKKKEVRYRVLRCTILIYVY